MWKAQVAWETYLDQVHDQIFWMAVNVNQDMQSLFPKKR
jgi:hypothetical protein